jgi:dipeptidyl aminopeptidase/acylaminoacyl peptidase
MTRREVLASVVAGASTVVWAQGSEVPVDAAQFFKRGQLFSAHLSPDGERIALRTAAPHGKVVLTVLELATMAPAVVYTHSEVDVDRVVWVNAKRLAFTMGDFETPDGKLDAGPGLFAVNHDGSEFKQLVERQRVVVSNGNDTQRLEPWNTFLLGGQRLDDSDDVLVLRPEAFSDKDLGYIRLLRINTKTGRVKDIDGPLHAVAWHTDARGEVRVCVTRKEEKGAVLWKDPQTEQWKTLTEFNVYTGNGDLHVSHVGHDGTLYVTARRGRDKQALWTLDPKTGNWSAEPLAQSPEYDLRAAVMISRDKVLGYRFTIDAEVTQWVDADMQSLQQAIDKVFPRTSNRLSTVWQGSSPWVTIVAQSDAQPALHFLFNRQTKKFSRLGALRPDIDPKKMATSDLVRVKAQDGLEVPCWLTLPANGAKTNLPTVVLVHGGPWVDMPSWHWNAEVQFLAARGYAVLQPQFRGTTGLGLKHERASWKQWGRTMQSDVADCTRWLVKQGTADPKRIAIAGGSYGGFAALMGLVRDPDLYRCAVAWVAVTDLDMLYSVNWSDASDALKKHGFPTLVGDRSVDAAALKDNSPLTHANKITQPLLLAYGEKDRRVPLVHGENFRSALQVHNPALEWVTYKDEGHGWRAPANQADFYNRVARFLDRHLALP